MTGGSTVEWRRHLVSMKIQSVFRVGAWCLRSLQLVLTGGVTRPAQSIAASVEGLGEKVRSLPLACSEASIRAMSEEQGLRRNVEPLGGAEISFSIDPNFSSSLLFLLDLLFASSFEFLDVQFWNLQD